MTITIYGAYVVETYDDLQFSSGPAFSFYYSYSATAPSLTNRGRATLMDGNSSINTVGLSGTGAFVNEAGAVFSVIGTNSQGYVNGVSGDISITNRGSVIVRSSGAATGYYGSYSLNLDNSGSFIVTGKSASVFSAYNGGALMNSGTIIANAQGTSFGVAASVSYSGFTKFENSGTIRVTDETAQIDSVAVRFDHIYVTVFNNSGLIEGDYAFREASTTTAVTTTLVTINNTGVIKGIVDFTSGAAPDLVQNKGTIQGDILLGRGDDTYAGATGSVAGVVYGGLGNDVLTGGSENNIFYGDDAQESGQDGNDILNGNGGDDRLYGQRGNDTLNGGVGDDLLVGGAGADILTGGAGADTFAYLRTVESLAGSMDVITDFASGQDKLDVAAAVGTGGSVTIDRTGTSTIVSFQAAGTGGYAGQISVTGVVQPSDVVAPAGTSFTIIGGAGADVIYSGAGNDTINGGAGIDTAVYSGPRAGYTVVRNANGGVTVADIRSGSPDGTDTLISVERLRFSDYQTSALLNLGGDYDGAGRSDLLFRNSGTGDLVGWDAANSSAATVLGSVDPMSRIFTGDLDGDGRTDLVLRNTASGENIVWNGGVASTAHALTAVGTEWRLLLTGDVDGDGRADLLFGDDSSGALVIWKGGDSANSAYLGAVGPEWKITAGDLDGDGRVDLIFRNTGGGNVVWSGGDASAARTLSPVDPVWSLAATGDFDGDGKTDLAFLNTSSGAVVTWSAGDSARAVFRGVTAPNSQVIAGDFDGDAYSDLLLHDPATGALVVWDRAVSTTAHTVGGVGAEWQIFG